MFHGDLSSVNFPLALLMPFKLIKMTMKLKNLSHFTSLGIKC